MLILLTQRFRDFERVYIAFKKVCSTWDEEEAKLLTVLRDLFNKKKEEGLKAVRKVQPLHRDLEDRFEELRKFL